MSQSMLILISDDTETIEKTKQQCQGTDCNLQVYSTEQWHEGIENSFFRQQLTSGMSLSMGSGQPSDYTGNVVQFPGTSAESVKASVEKIEMLEAKAIDNAIQQFKGNLTEAAKALGIGRATLYRKVKQYQIDPSTSRKRKVAA